MFDMKIGEHATVLVASGDDVTISVGNAAECCEVRRVLSGLRLGLEVIRTQIRGDGLARHMH